MLPDHSIGWPGMEHQRFRSYKGTAAAFEWIRNGISIEALDRVIDAYVFVDRPKRRRRSAADRPWRAR